ncbi:MAG: preprotein translocase subunit YajC [Acidobacteria bacterium]|nr:preprotein translocase subunit YajC [Acidobacteriota bacterium]
MTTNLILAQQSPSPATGALASFLPLILIGFIFYVLIFRPMRKRQRKLDQVISSLKSGDRVITTSGIYGTVAAVKENTILLKIADQVKIEIAKNAVASLQSGPES